MFVMHILVELEPNFKKYFLKPLDIDDDLVIDIYHINTDFAKFGIS